VHGQLARAAHAAGHRVRGGGGAATAERPVRAGRLAALATRLGRAGGGQQAHADQASTARPDARLNEARAVLRALGGALRRGLQLPGPGQRASSGGVRPQQPHQPRNPLHEAPLLGSLLPRQRTSESAPLMVGGLFVDAQIEGTDAPATDPNVISPLIPSELAGAPPRDQRLPRRVAQRLRTGLTPRTLLLLLLTIVAPTAAVLVFQAASR
jgi:hypothetical protein